MSPSGVLYVCVAASLFPAIFCQRKTAMSRHQLELKEHYEHLAYIAEFQCEHPHPRLIYMNDVLPKEKLHGKAYFPEVTVLYRCDKSVGSCDGIHRCGPTKVNNVNLPFKVTYLEAMEGRRKGDWVMEYHLLENHTTCGCLEYKEPPSKSAVHYHYIDPSLMQPQSSLPLDSTSQNVTGNQTSYEVPLYSFNGTSETSESSNNNEPGQETSQTPPYEPEPSENSQTPPNQPERNETSRPSIFDLTQMAEEELKPKPDAANEDRDADKLCSACSDPDIYLSTRNESSSVNEVVDTSTTTTTTTTEDSAYLDEESIRIDTSSPYDSFLKSAFP